MKQDTYFVTLPSHTIKIVHFITEQSDPGAQDIKHAYIFKQLSELLTVVLLSIHVFWTLHHMNW